MPSGGPPGREGVGTLSSGRAGLAVTGSNQPVATGDALPRMPSAEEVTMTIPATDVTAVPPKRRRSRVIVGLVITVVAAVVVAIGFVIVSVVIDRSWQ